MATAVASVRWSLICFLLGLLLPVLHTLYAQGAFTSISVSFLPDSVWVPNGLSVLAARFRGSKAPPQDQVLPLGILGQQKTEESARLLRSLRRDDGKWDVNHPRCRLLEGLKGYKLYEEGRRAELDGWRKKYKKLSRSQRELIDGAINYTTKLDTVEKRMADNARVADAILDYGLDFYGVPRTELSAYMKETANSSSNQQTGVMYALKHVVRDWTVEGLHERDPTFPCILETLRHEVQGNSGAARPRILVPGAGLGRLAHEMAVQLEGVDVVGNEWSAPMNLAYRYVTSLAAVNSGIIYPNVDWWSHRATAASLVRGVPFPDSLPATGARSTVELAEGDFTTALAPHYTGSFDAVVTYFFIDTARNIVTYLETIDALLQPGGIWVNFGPLLYGTNPSVQLSLDEVIRMAEVIGLDIESAVEQDSVCGNATWSDTRLRSKIVPYNADSESLSRNAYLAQFWVARKKM